MAYKCKVRIYLPLDNNGKPNLSDFGYYDLEISPVDNQTQQIVFDTHTQVNNPVFCYGHGNNSQGQMKIFAASKTTNIFVAPKLIFKWEFNASDEQVESFLYTMRRALDYSSGDASLGNYALYNVIRGPFTTYSIDSKNCFYATAYMCDLLGNDTLMEIYTENNSNTGYLNYKAWTMFNEHYTSWKVSLLNV